MRQLNFRRGPARMGIRNHVQRAAILRKGFSSSKQFIIHLNTLTCNICVRFIKKIFLLCRFKINHMWEDQNMHLFLAQLSVQYSCKHG
jgi:hypothetical protein